MKKNILIIGPSSEIAQEYINVINEKFNIYGISRKKIPKLIKINNILLNQAKDLDQKKLLKIIGKVKFFKIIFFSSDQINYPTKIIKIKNNRLYDAFAVNSLFPIKLTYFLIDNNLINKKTKFIYFSSRSGSITERGKLKHHLPKGNHVYRASKALLNSFVRNISFEFKKLNYIFVSYHPGWVATKSAGGKMSIKKSVSLFIKFCNSLKKSDTGNFFNFNKKKIPW